MSLLISLILILIFYILLIICMIIMCHVLCSRHAEQHNDVAIKLQGDQQTRTDLVSRQHSEAGSVDYTELRRLDVHPLRLYRITKSEEPVQREHII